MINRVSNANVSLEDLGEMVGRVGIEPTTKRLKVFCSTN